MTAKILNVMPVFNCASVVELGIRSVLEQTFADWHLVIVDDSTDETPAAVEALVGGDERVTHLRSNRWAPVPRKRDLGAAAVGSEYIAHWDCDNYYPPCRLEAQFSCVQMDHMAVSSIPFSLWARPATDDNVWQLKKNGHPLQLNFGGSFFLARDLWNLVSGFDTDKFPGEDYQIARKLQAAGAWGAASPGRFADASLGIEHGKNVWSGRCTENAAVRLDIAWREMLPVWAHTIVERACT